MLREFVPLTEPDLDALEAFNDQLRDVLMLLDDGAPFGPGGYSREGFRGLLASFVDGQRGSLGRTKPGSWSIAPDDAGMDGDTRVEFIFTPTYLVTAILSRALCDYPAIADEITGYKEALGRGMLFCTYRKLYGFGYEASAGAAEALTIMAIGKVPEVLERDKELCPKLHEVIEDTTKDMCESLEQGSAYGMWGESLQDVYSSALETLYLKNDREAYEAVMSPDTESELCGEEDLPW